MRFFFPDSQDQVDPHFDFEFEEHRPHRIRQRDDRYAHEVLRERPFDGLLISKPIVDGRGKGAAGHYPNSARTRLYREGVQSFFRLSGESSWVVTMGDCGAFTYAQEERPPYTVDEVIDFYDGCGLDVGIAPDHIVFGFVRSEATVHEKDREEWERRRLLTLSLAERFLVRHAERKCSFEPMAVAHGWSADSYADSASRLQEMGYSRIAMGGMVPLRTADILLSLEAVSLRLSINTQLHLLGVTRTEEVLSFRRLGVTSFDSTSPFRQAFKDDRDNYYTDTETYVALRVPQVDGNARIKQLVGAGRLDQGQLIRLERACLRSLRAFDRAELDVEVVVEQLMEYEVLVTGKATHEQDYRRTLKARPWNACQCGVCDRAGVEVAIFRGSERNKRRGFHNLAVFRRRLDTALAGGAS